MDLTRMSAPQIRLDWSELIVRSFERVRLRLERPLVMTLASAAATLWCAGGECWAVVGTDLTCPADLTGDDHVDGADLGVVLGSWLGSGGGSTPGDLDGDGMVDGADLGLLIGAWGECPAAPCPGKGSCFEANGTTGCDDEACCTAVCSVDDFCCRVQWDSICAATAFDVCGACGDARAGECCTANGTPGCHIAECCVEVCVDDSFCCERQWDQVCADAAANLSLCRCAGFP